MNKVRWKLDRGKWKIAITIAVSVLHSNGTINRLKDETQINQSLSFLCSSLSGLEPWIGFSNENNVDFHAWLTGNNVVNGFSNWTSSKPSIIKNAPNTLNRVQLGNQKVGKSVLV